MADPVKAAAIDKQLQAVELRKGGASYAAIARHIGYRSRNSAVKAVARGLRRAFQEPAEAVRQMECERLDRLLLAIWPRALTGELAAIDRVLAIMDRRAKYLGLDAPTKLKVKTTGGTPISYIAVVPPKPRGNDHSNGSLLGTGGETVSVNRA